MIYLGIGSNLSSSIGNRFENINLALSFLKSAGIKVIKRSSFYETLAIPNENDPKFINIVASIQTDLSPIDLMSVLIFIEEKLERKRNKKNDPRTCDIDIIDYNREILDLKFKGLNLEIPHKELNHRNFVLIPLKEICPNWKHPKTGEIINTLIQHLSEDDRKSILKTKES
tara:strand:+ start:411 stop:923 length:513 start_codon:yes stop_codon:yes gene_type:complete